MASSISETTNSDEKKRGRGRPVTTGTGQGVNVRLKADAMAALDEYCSAEDPPLARADGLRRLAVESLKAKKLLP